MTQQTDLNQALMGFNPKRHQLCENGYIHPREDGYGCFNLGGAFLGVRKTHAEAMHLVGDSLNAKRADRLWKTGEILTAERDAARVAAATMREALKHCHNILQAHFATSSTSEGRIALAAMNAARKVLES